ncbi:phage portal protein [Kitasatospora sp. NPDC006786]|uniref:phage portal protein n=1 Tax=unclassified Kitasatospora TaxID=2633591 RepID=UPI003406ECCA
MSLLFGRRPAAEQRAAVFSDRPIPGPAEIGSTSYAAVDLTRAEASLQQVAIWACINLTCSAIETMPLDCYRCTSEGPKTIPTPGYLLDLGGDGHGTADWLWQAMYSWMTRGNQIGTVLARSPTGTPTQVVLHHPDDVRPVRLDDGTYDWWINGRRTSAGSIWHKRVFPTPGHLMGLSPIGMHALTIGTGLAAARFGAAWFEDGGHPSALLTNTESNLDQQQAATVKARFLAALRGTREPVVFGKGWKYEQISVPANESQFLETMGYSSAECCRIYGPGYADVFGYETGGSLTYANVEQRSLDLLTYAINPWLVRMEKLLSALLPQPQYVRFNRDALVRTDLLTRFRAHEIALRNRWATVNEVRVLEDSGPVAWGDQPNGPTPAPPPAPAPEEG